MTRTVFVGNLSFDTRKESLADLFGEVGEILRLTIPMDRETHQPRGIAFVEYGAPSSANRAVDLINGTELDGRKLRVSIAHTDQRPAPRRSPRVADEEDEAGFPGGPTSLEARRNQRDDGKTKGRGSWRDERHRRAHRTSKGERGWD